MRRYGPAQVHLHLYESDARLYLRLRAPYVVRADIVQSFRSSFGRHGQATYLPAQRVWSINMSERDRLYDWLGRTFTADAVQDESIDPPADEEELHARLRLWMQAHPDARSDPADGVRFTLAERRRLQAHRAWAQQRGQGPLRPAQGDDQSS